MKLPDPLTIYIVNVTLWLMLGILLLHVRRQDREIERLRDERIQLVRIGGEERLIMPASTFELLRKFWWTDA